MRSLETGTSVYVQPLNGAKRTMPERLFFTNLWRDYRLIILYYTACRLTSPKQWYTPPEIPAPSKLHVRNIDYTLNNLFITGAYKDALSLALQELKIEEANVGRDGREYELLDCSIRCALRTGDIDLGARLADRTREKVKLTLHLFMDAQPFCNSGPLCPVLRQSLRKRILHVDDHEACLTLKCNASPWADLPGLSRCHNCSTCGNKPSGSSSLVLHFTGKGTTTDCVH